MVQDQLAHEVGQFCGSNNLPTYPSTAGLAPAHVQANLVILPSKYASDFRALCQRNPVPCPLISESPPGDPTRFIHSPGTGFSHSVLTHKVDVRIDLPKYNIYRSKVEFVDR